MTKKSNRAYSRYTLEALKLLAGQIKSLRIEKAIKAQDLAKRAGISRDLLYRIESADPACSIGLVFEVAAILGLPLFYQDYSAIKRENKIVNDKLALLPSRVDNSKQEIKDDF